MLVRWPRYVSHLPGGRDVIGRALALRLQQHAQPVDVVAVPRRERRRAARAGRSRARPRSVDARGVGGRRGRSRSRRGRSRARAGRRRRAGRTRSRNEPSSRPLSAMPTTVSGEPMNASVFLLPSLRAGKLRLNDVTITFGPVRRVVALPLADARTARVGEHGRADRLEVGEQPVALDRGAHLLGTGRDHERRLHAQPARRGLAREVRGAADVLVRRVRARTDERGRDLARVALALGLGRDLRDGPVEIGRVRTDEMRLQRRRGRSRSTRSK